MKVERHPKFCPSHVPKGTPKTFATVSPPNIIEIAVPFLSLATKPIATTAPIPKKAPWQSAETTRPISITSKVFATPDIKLPAINKSMSDIRTFLRSYFVTETVINIPPIATLNAYIDTNKPDLAVETEKSLAILGSNPTIANSVRPIPNPPVPIAKSAIGSFPIVFLIYAPLNCMM